jgi:hypothetical protein
MIVISCSSCALAIRVMGEPAEVHSLVGERSGFWPDRYTCPSCGGHAEAQAEPEFLASAQGAAPLRDLTVFEAFAALEGLGFPEEHECVLDVVENLLRSTPVRRVAGRSIRGSRRSYIDHLELWDGTKIFLGAGPGGAVVYRIAKPPSYANRDGHERDAEDHP